MGHCSTASAPDIRGGRSARLHGHSPPAHGRADASANAYGFAHGSSSSAGGNRSSIFTAPDGTCVEHTGPCGAVRHCRKHPCFATGFRTSPSVGAATGMGDAPGISERHRFGTAPRGIRLQPTASDCAVPPVLRHGSQDGCQDWPVPCSRRSDSPPGATRSFAFRGRKTISRLRDWRRRSQDRPDRDRVDASGPRLRVL